MTATIFKPIPFVLPSGSPKPLTAVDISFSSTSTSQEQSTSKPFQRFRSSLEQTLRTATRSRKSTPPDDIATASTSSANGKDKAQSEDVSREKGKSKMLQRLPSRVPFRRGARETATPSPIPPSGTMLQENEGRRGEVRVAGFTSFQTPSLRQASISSPVLHLSSQAMPSPKSQSAVPVSSTSNVSALVSPVREHSRKASTRREISSPIRLGSRRDKPDLGDSFIEDTPSRHRATKSNPPVIPSSSSTPSLPSKHSNIARSRGRVSANRLERDLPSTPENPTPVGGARGYAPRGSSQGATGSSNHPTTGPPSPEPNTFSGGISPIRARSPTVRTRVVSPSRVSPSAYSSSSPTPRKPYVEQPRRTSLDAPRRTSLDTQRRFTESLIDSRADSPSPVRRRATSPIQRSYAQNRHFKIVPDSPEHRELIRTATSMLCREMIRPPPHMSKSESGTRDWEEVKRRIAALARLERVWGKSGAINQESPGGGILSGSGEERERKLFSEALKDGFILCQLINKLRSSSIVRPDPREDGIFRSSNVTKFLAACASYGLQSEDLFQPDDLTAVTSEPLARVAKTVIALINFVESPLPSKIISGKGKKMGSVPVPIPYQNSGTRGSTSTPNLHSSHSPPSSPTRRRWSPPSTLPPVRSNSSEEDSYDSFGIKAFDSSPDEHDEEDSSAMYAGSNSSPAFRLMPPPKSTLRPRPIKRAQNSSASFTAADYETQNLRQSVASSAMTETTVTTVVSSILDNGRSWSGQNKFGTIRTVTTDMTSEAPSLSRTEGSFIADDMARRKSQEGVSKFRDRKLSETPLADLTRVAEEPDESVSSKGDVYKGKNVNRPERTEKIAIHLHKGRWPDDFMDAFGNGKTAAIKAKTPPLELDEEILFSSTMSTSPQRDSPLAGKTRLPDPSGRTHRPRYSVDNPGLMPRETLRRRETSPDGFPPPRVMLRRHSTKPSTGNRNAIYLPRSLDDNGDEDGDSTVPFPRARPRGNASGGATPLGESPSNHERFIFPRGRFQSDVEDSITARRRMHPNGVELVGRSRSRIESMVSLGVSSNASASDLLRRESVDGSRKTIIVKEDGKPAVHYQLGICIGRGQFGSVYKALNLSTGQTVAIKQIRLEGLKEAEVAELMREVNIYKRLSHPGIVRYEGMARDKETLSIVLEYAENGSLGQTMKAYGRLNERLVASYVTKILEGLHYLHGQDVVHCDLKAANILSTKTGNVKLTDFGVSLNLRAMEREIKNVAGTPNWMAPEIIELKGASAKSDIWSLGCTVIELLTGRPPYAEISNSMTVMFRIVEDAMPPIPEECSDLARQFLLECFNKEPSKRPGAELLFEHPWLKQNWGVHKELRPQDSIPFLRRVSADLQKSEAVRYLSDASVPDNALRSKEATQPPPERRLSTSTSHPLGESDISPREHSFVKTTFSKPMHCRVCLLDVKKSAVICSQCSLISHSKCAPNAPPTCDLRAQLLLYAQYAEKGNPASLYQNPADALGANRPTGALSDVPYVTHSEPSPPPDPVQPSTGFKFISVFKRSSRSNLAEHTASVSTSQPPLASGDGKVVRRKTAFLIRNKDRPHSLMSNSTGVSSPRSAAGSLSSGPDARKSRMSNTSVDGGGARHSDPEGRSRMASVVDSVDGDDIPGSLLSEIRKQRDSRANSGCIVQ